MTADERNILRALIDRERRRRCGLRPPEDARRAAARRRLGSPDRLVAKPEEVEALRAAFQRLGEASRHEASVEAGLPLRRARPALLELLAAGEVEPTGVERRHSKVYRAAAADR